MKLKSFKEILEANIANSTGPAVDLPDKHLIKKIDKRYRWGNFLKMYELSKGLKYIKDGSSKDE